MKMSDVQARGVTSCACRLPMFHVRVHDRLVPSGA